MPVCRVLKKCLLITNEIDIPITLLAVATIWVVGSRKPAPELRTGVAQQAADIGFQIPTHHDTLGQHGDPYSMKLIVPPLSLQLLPDAYNQQSASPAVGTIYLWAASTFRNSLYTTGPGSTQAPAPTVQEAYLFV